MKNKFFKLLTLLFVCVLFAFGLTACENEITSSDSGSENSGIVGINDDSFKTLTVEGKNVYGVFPNATTEFSFADEIVMPSGLDFEVSKDEYGSQTYPTKTVPLEEGNNVFYVFTTLGGEGKATYTVTLRRRPIYTVSFKDGDTVVENKAVEEDSVVTAPENDPEKAGYAFRGWDYDFTQPITENTSVIAKWTNRILVVEYFDGDSDGLETLLTGNGYPVDVKNVADEDFPTSVTELYEYRQVILNNIANSDMPAGFDELLNEYVHDYGGGLFTVGGTNDTAVDGTLVPHAYNRNDMIGTLYQEMLPVQVVDYAPPVAVMILIDSSGSMGSGEGSALAAAFDGAFACLEALTSFDYYGVATFQDRYDEGMKVTSVSNRTEIVATLEELEKENSSSGGTVYATALEGAGMALSAVDVERRHIILITDGMPSDTGKYEDFIETNKNKGITMSVVCIQATVDTVAKMQEDAMLGGGKCYNVQDMSKLASMMRLDLTTEAVEEIAYGEEFQPKIDSEYAELYGIEQLDIPVLTGYYGTQLKEGATVVLSGEYVPIYAEWDYGKGVVGSFMCDLGGVWSKTFLKSETGRKLLLEILDRLFSA